jgi:hypothetical protein
MINDPLFSFPRNAFRRRILLACAVILPLLVAAREPATIVQPSVAPDGARSFTPNEADDEQLNVPNGCFLEAIRFKALHPGNDSGIIVVDLKRMKHAIVAYPKNGKLWSHCAMLGDIPLGLKASELTRVKRVQHAYFNSFCEKLERVERKGDRWPVNESRPGDTPAICVARATQAMTALRIKNAMVAYTKPDGQKAYALLTALAKSLVIYSPEVGSIQLAGPEFGPDAANSFAQKYLRFTPVAVSYQKPAEILGEHASTAAAFAAQADSREEKGGSVVAGMRSR